MEIRRAKKQDIREIIGLLSEVLEIHASLRPDIFNSGVTKFHEEDLEKMILDDDNPIYVVTIEDRVVAHAFCKTKYPSLTHLMKPIKTLYVDDFCVKKEFRHKNIGKELFEFIKREAVKANYNEITLNVWEDNIDAYKFYEKMGLTTRSRTMEYKL